MNVKLLKRVRDRIAARPRQFVMCQLFDTETESHTKVSHCGTAACIAGWAFTLSRKLRPKDARPMAEEDDPSGYVRGWVEAEGVLMLTSAEAHRLFLSDHWPQPFQKHFNNASSPIEHAKIAVRRINHFIKTKGEE